MATALDNTGNDDGPVPEPSLRDDIDAAFAQHATDETTEPTAAERARDEQGRFAPKTTTGQEDPANATAAPAKAAPATGAAQPTRPGATAPGTPVAAPATPELKAPASWTPAAREKWATVDPELRQEIHRREVEGQRVLQESASLRSFAQQFSDIVRPYEVFIRSENSDPLRAVQNLMNTAAQLRMGTPQSKVDIVANIVRQHNIDLNMLDDTLAKALGVTQPGQQVPQQPMQDPRLDQLLYHLNQQSVQAQQQQAQREAWEDQALQEGLTQFAATHEFYDDVAADMADLVDAANRRGIAVDLEKIYTRACQLNEQVATILSQRGPAARPGAQQQQRGGSPSQAVLRAKRAASSVGGEPNPPEGSTVPKNDTVRAAIEAAFDSHSS